MAELVYSRTSNLAVLAERAINIVIGLIELLLAVRLVLELLGANGNSGFVAWIYSVSGNMVAPFQGAFPSLPLGGSSVLDFSTILAMIVYAVIGWLIARVVYFAFSGL